MAAARSEDATTDRCRRSSERDPLATTECVPLSRRGPAASNAYAEAGKQCTRRGDDGDGGGVSARSQRETLQRLTSAWTRCWVRRGPMPEARSRTWRRRERRVGKVTVGYSANAAGVGAVDELRASRMGWGDVPRLGQYLTSLESLPNFGVVRNKPFTNKSYIHQTNEFCLSRCFGSSSARI